MSAFLLIEKFQRNGQSVAQFAHGSKVSLFFDIVVIKVWENHKDVIRSFFKTVKDGKL